MFARILIPFLLVLPAGMASAAPVVDECRELPGLPPYLNPRSVCVEVGTDPLSASFTTTAVWAEANASEEGVCADVLSKLGCAGPGGAWVGDPWNEPWLAVGPEPSAEVRLAPYFEYDSDDGLPTAPECVPMSGVCAASEEDGTTWASVCTTFGCNVVTRAPTGELHVDAAQRWHPLDAVIWIGAWSYQSVVVRPDATADTDAAVCPAGGICYDAKAWLEPTGAHGRYGDALMCIVVYGCPPRGGWAASAEGATAWCEDSQGVCQFVVRVGPEVVEACKTQPRVPVVLDREDHCERLALAELVAGEAFSSWGISRGSP